MYMYLLILVATITLPLSLQAQNVKERTIVNVHWKDAPVELVKIKSVHGPLKVDKPIAQDEMWLKGLTLKLRNNTNKTITSVSYVFTIHSTGKSGQSPIGTELQYGGPNGTGAEAVPIPPGGEFELSLSDHDFNLFVMGVEKRKKIMNDILKARLSLQIVCFDDGTCWVAGSILPATSFIKAPEHSMQQESFRPKKIRPQIAFCGAVSYSYQFPCCSCPGHSHSYTQYQLREASQGEPRYFICTFTNQCDCPDTYIQCTGHMLESCTSEIGICPEF